MPLNYKKILEAAEFYIHSMSVHHVVMRKEYERVLEEVRVFAIPLSDEDQKALFEIVGDEKLEMSSEVYREKLLKEDKGEEDAT